MKQFATKLQCLSAGKFFRTAEELSTLRIDPTYTRRRRRAPLLDVGPPATRSELKDCMGDKVTVRSIANASHALIPEQPAAVADAIIEWARGLEQVTGP